MFGLKSLCGTSSASFIVVFKSERWRMIFSPISFLPCSSGDSTGSSAEQSIAAYDALADNHPTSVLTLNHETHISTMCVPDNPLSSWIP